MLNIPKIEENLSVYEYRGLLIDALEKIDELQVEINKLKKELDKCQVNNVDNIIRRHVKLLELSTPEILLLGGEMTAQELRTVKAVLHNRAQIIKDDLDY